MKKFTVLIVDDSPTVTDGLRSILSAYPDIELVGEASGGLEAIAKAEELRPDVILMDAQMPEVDGVEATRAIKEQMPDTKIDLFVKTPRQPGARWG